VFGDSDIRERMAVYDCGGALVGTVERVEGASICLAGGPGGAGRPYVHLYWVESVGRGVRLDLSRDEVSEECQVRALGVPAA
jgi:hypothetical protein